MICLKNLPQCLNVWMDKSTDVTKAVRFACQSVQTHILQMTKYFLILMLLMIGGCRQPLPPNAPPQRLISWDSYEEATRDWNIICADVPYSDGKIIQDGAVMISVYKVFHCEGWPCWPQADEINEQCGGMM